VDEATKKPHGFAAWTDKERLRRVAAKGGRAVHAAGKGHVFTTDEARAAGRKGGIAVHAAARRKKAEQDSTPGGEKVGSGS
jgi:uncharacterized protein